MKKFFIAVGMLSLIAIFLMPASVSAVLKSNTANSTIVTPGGSSGSDALGAGCGNLGDGGLAGLVGCIIGIFGYVIIVLIAAAVVIVIYGAFQMISSEEKRATGRQTVIYGIVGLFVMVSVWGFVSILNNTFNLSSSGPIDPPKLIKK